MGMFFLYMFLIVGAVCGAAAMFLRKTGRGMWKPATIDGGNTSATVDDKSHADIRRLGYRYAEEGPFFFIKDQGVWTGVRITGASDEFDTLAEQNDTVNNTTKMYQLLLDLFTNKDKKHQAQVRCHEFVRNRPVDTSEWMDHYVHSHWDPSTLMSALIDGQIEPHIAEASPERAHYLLVRLCDQKGPVHIDAIGAAINADDQLCDELFTAAELNKFRRLASEVLDRLSPYAAPMTRPDLAWLIRKPLHGTFDVDMDRDYARTRFVRNSWFDQITEFNGHNLKPQAAVEIFDPKPTLTATPQSCFTTTLTVSTAESMVPFDYWNAWARVLSGLPNPPEISWRYTLVSESVFSKIIRKATNQIADEVKDRTKDGSEEALADTKFGYKAAMSEDVRASFDLRPRAGMVGQLRISLSAPTLELLAASEQAVKDAMKGFAVMERRRNIQHHLLEEQLPGDFDSGSVGKLVASTDTGALEVGTRFTDMDVLAMARMDYAPTVGDDVEYSRLGDRLGWHGHVIGYAAENGSIVHFDPFVQIDRNTGAGIAILGASGSGKSTLAMTMFFFVSESGAQTVVVDPKNDFEKHCHYIAFGPQVLEDGFREEANRGTLGTPDSQFQPINRDYWDNTRIVSLTFGASGSMDPWILTGDYESGEQLARRQIEHLFADLPSQDERRSDLDIAFADLRKTYEGQVDGDGNPRLPRLTDLVTQLASKVEHYQGELQRADGGAATDRIAIKRELDRLEVLQNRLHNAARADYSRLLFGGHDADASASALRGFSHRRTIITMIGFELPNDPSKIATIAEARAGSAAMFTVLWQIKRLFSDVGETISPNRRSKGLRPRILFVDESYMITGLESGAELLSVLLRQGRSVNFGCVIIDQQPDGIGKIEAASAAKDDPDQNQFPTIFIFKQRGLPERRAAVRLLRSGVNLTDAERDALAAQLELPTGYCVMKDMDGRVSTVAVDPLFRELFAAAQTNPTQRPKYQSEPISASAADWHLQTEIRDSTRRNIVRDRLDDAINDVAVFEYPEVSAGFATANS